MAAGRSQQRARWRSWPGQHTFLCNGRVMLGSGGYCAIATLLLCVLAPAVLAAVFLLPHLNVAFFASCGVLLAVTVYSLVRTAVTDPGIVPRRAPSLPAPELPEELDVGGQHRRFCETCNLYRPLRAKHCRFCDQCVEEFDHHCPWAGNCIGRRNYRHFLTFIGSAQLLALLIVVACVLRFAQLGRSPGIGRGDDFLTRFSEGWQHAPLLALLFVFAVAASLALCSLVSYHCELLHSGRTTNEAVRGVYRHYDNPHNRGCWGNLRRACCDPLPPSRLPDLRAPPSP